MAAISSNQPASEPFIRLARLVLWFVVVTASFKLTEVFGPGEQSWAPPPASDLTFRCVILAGTAFSFAVAAFAARIRKEALLFFPFLLWTIVVSVFQQTDLNSAKQIGSYASWIVFFAAAEALFKRPKDYRTLALLMVGAVFLSALGGEIQHLFGFAPRLGSKWPNTPDMEFQRTHTGSGGILLDAFTPYCAAILLISTAGDSVIKRCLAWLLVLWGTANILRGGILALTVGLAWYLWMMPGKIRKRTLPLAFCALACGLFLFGNTVKNKIFENGEQVNTSGRLDEWPQLISWIAEEPIIGHGPNADMDLLADSAGRDLRASHNELLSTGVNYGVVGIILLWTPLGLLLFSKLSEATRLRPEDREQTCAATAVLLMIVLLSFTDNTLRSPGVMIIALAPIAVAQAKRTDTVAARENLHPYPPPTFSPPSAP